MKPTKLLAAFTLAIATSLGLYAAPAEEKPDNTEFSKLIHQAVIAQAPKQYEDRSSWGKTIPIPDKLRLPGLRTRVKVGDKEELPHDHWKRTRVWVDDPAKNIQIQVRDVRKVDDKITRVQVEATVALHAERERQQWSKGLHLFSLTVRADATVGVTLDCDVAITLNTSKFPPELKIEPKVADCQLELKEFDLIRVGKLIEGADARELGNELKDILKQLIRLYEPDVKERTNQAIAKGLKEGKGAISAESLLKAGVSPKTKK
jgi:hypothetical protein